MTIEMALRPARCWTLALLACSMFSFPGHVLAADLPLSEQLPTAVTLSENAYWEAHGQVVSASNVAERLRQQVQACERKVAAKFKDLKDNGGAGAADNLSNTPVLDTRIDLAHTLAQAAERGNNPFFNVAPALAPYLKAVESALRELQSKQLQLAAAESRVQLAQTNLDAATAKLEEAKRNAAPDASTGSAQVENFNSGFLNLTGSKIVLNVDTDVIRFGVPRREDNGGSADIRYFTPRFSGYHYDLKYEPSTGGDTNRDTADAGDDNSQSSRLNQRAIDYLLGNWQPRTEVSPPQKPENSGAQRSSQAAAAVLSGPAEKLGNLAYPSDRFFNRRSSWGQDFDDQWALKRIGFETTQDVDAADGLWPVAGHRVIVAVLDTGLDRGHPELAGMVQPNRREIFGNGIDDDGNGFSDDFFGWNFITETFDTWDDNGHGTFVAGIIAARTDNGLGIAGVNPHARILPVKVTDHQHASGSRLIAKGIRYAVDRGARVINISIGGPELTEEEAEAVRYAIAKDVLVVVAAGNLGVDTATFGPAGTGGVVTVAATDRNDARAGYSNWGRAVDIAAPGQDVLSLRAISTDMIAKSDADYEAGSAFVGGAQDYYVASGTSFAAPFVSGVASLLFSMNPKLTGAQVKRMLLQSARDIDVPGVDQNTGYGLLDARAALAADPEFFVEATISGLSVVASGGGRALRVAGTADADDFAGARVEIGSGDAPTEWEVVADDIRTRVQDGTIADIPVGKFRGSKLWTLRVIVRHAGGREREGRFVLRLG